MMTINTRWMVVLAAGCLMAQAPIGMGPGKLVRYIELPANGHTYGDTPYFSAWLSNTAAANLPVPAGLPIVGTSNDGINNVRVYQLDSFDWASSTIHATLVNAMTAYGTESSTNTPGGWWSYCSQIQLGSPPTSDSGQGCSWKSREPLARGGCIYLPIGRQVTAGTGADHDSTIIRSCDAGRTWSNPYTIATSGTPDANGDPPKPFGDASYPGSIMWPMMPAAVYNWSFIQYGQDGSLPGGIGGGCDPSVYACAVLGDGTLGRAPNASIMDVSTWTYYTGRIIGNSLPDGNDPANWTSTFSAKSTTSFTPAIGSKTFIVPSGLSFPNGSRARIKSAGSSGYMEGLVTSYSGTSLTVNVDAYGGSGAQADWNITTRSYVFEMGVAAAGLDYVRLAGTLGAPAYLKEFKSYLMSGFFIWPNGMYTVGFMAAPQPWGPWKTVYIHDSDPAGHGFPTISLAVGYTVVSTNPPVVRVTNVTNGGAYEDYFQQWEFTLGRQPYGNGDVSAYTDIGIKKLNSGWVFGAGDVAGTFNRKGLVWAFDFMDHGGDPAAQYPYFHDVANNSAILYPCFTDGAITCGYMGGKGLVPNVDSISTQTGYSERYESRLGELNTGASTPNLNAPSAMTGNGTFSVVGVFRRDPDNDGPYWVTGDTSNGNTSVGMYIEAGGGKHLGLLWGGSNSNRWRYLSSFVPSVSSWYFMAATVQANGNTPTAHLWTGVGGALVDEIAGVTYAKSGGSTTPTPNVTGGPLVLGTDINTGITLNASYAGLLVYNRVLSATECQGLYRTFKTKMRERGIALQ